MSNQLSEFKAKLNIIDTNTWTDINLIEVKITIIQVNNGVWFQYILNKKIVDKAKEVRPDLYENLPTTIRGITFEDVKEAVWDICNNIISYETFKDVYGDKVIFINFNGQKQSLRHGWCGAGMGNSISINFNFFVGYKLTYKKKLLMGEEKEEVKYSSEYKISEYSKQEYKRGTIVPMNNTIKDREAIEQKYLIVPYTEEIEKFLTDLENKFVNLNEELNKYLGNLNSEKLRELIANTTLKLLS